MNTTMPGVPEPVLAIPVDTACYIVRKLREYENMDLLVEREELSNPLEREDVDELVEQENEYSFDPVRQELVSFIGDLTEDQKIDLVALMWLGRNNASAADWQSIRDEAAQAYNARTSDYILGSPLAGDFLEEGLSALGYACDVSGEEAP
ncbi:DUF3775 domain-containing protein [Rhodanobacter aciditrophus]|uniref:DUF3775 domain-containing protein n=1 Tax=Rhodanobacter aciditrophus TaxID=1623218 RepID=UPI003CED2A63